MYKRQAPILSFTAEEAWPLFAPALHREQGETIFTQTYHVYPQPDDAHALLPKWARIRELRSLVLKELEASRTAGAIGSSLQAEVVLTVSPEDHALLATLGDDLRFVLITSKATLKAASGAAPITVEVAASGHAKCERCWHLRDDVGHDPAHPTLCGRCTSNLFGAGESRHVA